MTLGCMAMIIMTIINGTATSPAIDTLGAGPHTISATYSGDANFEAILHLNRDDERQRLPEVVFNAVRGRSEPV